MDVFGRVSAEDALQTSKDKLGARLVREGDELARLGLYLDMPAWGYHAFVVREVDPVKEPR